MSRGRVVLKLSEKVADDPENNHQHDIKNSIVDAVGADQTKEEGRG